MQLSPSKTEWSGHKLLLEWSNKTEKYLFRIEVDYIKSCPIYRAITDLLQTMPIKFLVVLKVLVETQMKWHLFFFCLKWRNIKLRSQESMKELFISIIMFINWMEININQINNEKVRERFTIFIFMDSIVIFILVWNLLCN